MGESSPAALVEANGRVSVDQTWPEWPGRASTAGVTRSHGRVAILGGGMAGLSAAWRLSEAGWRDRFEAIAVDRRGWRLGGKGASAGAPRARRGTRTCPAGWAAARSRRHARECYAGLDRATKGPDAPSTPGIRPGSRPTISGMADRRDEEGWSPSRFARNDEVPGEPKATGREFTVVGFVRRALRLVLDFADSLARGGQLVTVTCVRTVPIDGLTWLEVVRWGTLATLATPGQTASPRNDSKGSLARALDTVREALEHEQRADHRRFWLFLSLLTATDAESSQTSC